MHRILPDQAAVVGTVRSLDVRSSGSYSVMLNNEGEATMRLISRFLLVIVLLGEFVVSALCQQAQSSGTTGSIASAWIRDYSAACSERRPRLSFSWMLASSCSTWREKVNSAGRC